MLSALSFLCAPPHTFSNHPIIDQQSSTVNATRTSSTVLICEVIPIFASVMHAAKVCHIIITIQSITFGVQFDVRQSSEDIARSSRASNGCAKATSPALRALLRPQSGAPHSVITAISHLFVCLFGSRLPK
jgi:hypothetical protein